MKKKVLIPILAFALLVTTASFKNDFFEIAKQIEIFTTLFKEINMNYVDETNPAALMESAIDGMLDELDPYTKYWTEQEVEDAKINNSGEYSGIGATVRTNEKEMIIVEPREGYPADEAGLKAGDAILRIGDIVVATVEGDAGELLQGSPGSTVAITYERQGNVYETTLKRSAVEIDAVPYYKMIDENTGYIVLTTFNKKASAQVREALLSLKTEGATSIVLDLRNNGGGLLNEAIKIVNLFIPKGEVVTTTKSVIKKYNKVYKTPAEAVDTKIPLVILVNGRSASASEIVAGGLQDYDRAVIIGARSFGKGLVQRPKPLTYGTQLKVTISRYFTPSGRCIQALDYWNRDNKGNAIRTSSDQFNEFSTKNGRKVYDGGGIMPDIEVSAAKLSPISKALLEDHAIFDFATQFYYEHPFETLSDFSFTDADYATFTTYIKNSNFDYETDTESAFAKAITQAERDGFKNELEALYSKIRQTIDETKEKELNIYKEEIEGLLTDEIVKRYFYREGLYDYQLANNQEIKEAVAILNNSNRYARILK